MMKNIRRYITLSLATCIMVSPLVARAENKAEVGELIAISIPGDGEEEIEMPDYIEYKGKITDINKGENHLSILVKDNEEEEYNGMLFHVNEDVILLDDETRDFIKAKDLEVGMTVTGYYSKDTIMLMSMPPQLRPDILIVNKSEEPEFINVSKYSYIDKDLVNTDNTLQILLSDTIMVVDKDGNKLELEDIADKDLIVFYNTSTKSIPAQTRPEKIIVMGMEDEKEEIPASEPEITVLDKIVINGKEINLDSNLYKNKEEVMMMPLREIAEILGYEITWNNEARRAELTKGVQWTAVTIGEDNYNFARMLIKLGAAPEIKDSNTYVPYNFFTEVLRVDIMTIEDGKIIIYHQG